MEVPRDIAKVTAELVPQHEENNVPNKLGTNVNGSQQRLCPTETMATATACLLQLEDAVDCGTDKHGLPVNSDHINRFVNRHFQEYLTQAHHN